MGLAASQGRLLLLTARKSDLEYSAQQISQRRLLLSCEMESISAEYANKTSNRQMKIFTQTSQGANTQVEKNLTWALINDKNVMGGEYRVLNASGDVVVPDKANLPKTDEYSDDASWKDKSDATYTRNTNGKFTKTDKDGAQTEVDNLPADADLTSGSSKTYVYDEELGVSTELYEFIDANGKKQFEKTNYVIDPNVGSTTELDNPFQEGLRNGTYMLQLYKYTDATDQASAKWTNQNWSSMDKISDKLYTDDDAAAQAKYQTASAKIQTQDKRLEMELNNIETQHKAVETEVESVKSVIKNNIEGSFKMFS